MQNQFRSWKLRVIVSEVILRMRKSTVVVDSKLLGSLEFWKWRNIGVGKKYYQQNLQQIFDLVTTKIFVWS